jgi:uncharacterized protein DUF3775
MADTIPTLSISAEKVCFIVVKAREFDVKDVLTDEDDGSNAADDGMMEVLEDHPDDPVVQELPSFIAVMNEDEQIDLVTLAWLGRGDGDPGMSCARKPYVRTTNAPRRTCSACPSCPTISKRPSRISISLARISSATGSEVICDLARKQGALVWRGIPKAVSRRSPRIDPRHPIFVSAKPRLVAMLSGNTAK